MYFAQFRRNLHYLDIVVEAVWTVEAEAGVAVFESLLDGVLGSWRVAGPGGAALGSRSLPRPDPLLPSNHYSINGLG